MFKTLIILVAGLMSFVTQAVDYQGWTLRFAEARGFRNVATGCLGTASYDYGMPDSELVAKFGKPLFDQLRDLKIETHTAWAEVDDEMKYIDLSDGSIHDPAISTIGPWPSADEKHLVLCPCRSEYKNCGKLKDFPFPLGTPFVIESE